MVWSGSVAEVSTEGPGRAVMKSQLEVLDASEVSELTISTIETKTKRLTQAKYLAASLASSGRESQGRSWYSNGLDALERKLSGAVRCNIGKRKI